MSKKIKMKIPFVHYKLESPEILQAVLLIAVGLSALPILKENFGLTDPQAYAAVFVAEALGLLHVLFADPVVPGWIASALPLITVFLSGYATVDVDPTARLEAMIALQILVSLVFLILGITGLAHKIMKIIPGSLKAGILFGVSIAAVAKVFGKGGYVEGAPITIIVSCVVALVVVFSVAYKNASAKSKVLRQIGKYGMLSSLVVAMIVGFATGEVQLPVFTSRIITPFDFAGLFRTASPFSIGFPSLQTFITLIPMALAVYIIAFGDIITAEAVLQEAKEARPDEKLDFNSNRTNVISGVRNLILALFMPYPPMAGPLWAAVTVSVGERYKAGKESMKTMFGGAGSFKLATTICVLIFPIVTLLGPVLHVALACTYIIQAFACSYIAIDQVKGDKIAAGVAGLTGGIIYMLNLNWGLAVGIFCFITMENGVAKMLANRKKSLAEKNTPNE
ncbi:hypothetical protein SAMN02745823_02863 [Sporobacter termitidis DSM 10068]|uniref:Permease family protein n=1 Tax=Sporobacter termitidis DSM 10068 TaxID=1123282 RepID=A0A1M5YVJ0_9FIRM|nr:hypothetical protein [Sporobacter termitidis]SHI15864.1 hypothetical protein SAMN02745823_02863 [Sporobacter termitidis DSM 10068]